MGKLVRDKGNNPIQAMPIVEGKVGLVAPAAGLKGSIILCTADGTVTITFASAGTVNVAMVQGDIRTLTAGSSVTIVSGTFDMA